MTKHVLDVDTCWTDATNESVGTSSSSPTQRFEILVVEDDPVWRRVIVQRSTMLGLAAAEAASAEDALAWLEHHEPPRLVCLDLSLPTMSGFRLCELLRASPQTSRVAVLVLSARTSLQDRTLAMEVGADAFLEKPCRWNAFEDAVHTLLRGSVSVGASWPSSGALSAKEGA